MSNLMLMKVYEAIHYLREHRSGRWLRQSPAALKILPQVAACAVLLNDIYVALIEYDIDDRDDIGVAKLLVDSQFLFESMAGFTIGEEGARNNFAGKVLIDAVPGKKSPLSV
jgi:hypothetical protein